MEEKASEIFAATVLILARSQWPRVRSDDPRGTQATKNHPGGENSKSSAESGTRLFSTGEDDDAFASLNFFVSKLNPSCSAFFQHPKQSVNPEDAVWYENRPLGVNKLGEMMKTISVGAKLSQIYTNHSVRASAIALLSDANVPDRHIMFVSGHSSEQSIAHYVIQLTAVCIAAGKCL